MAEQTELKMTETETQIIFEMIGRFIASKRLEKNLRQSDIQAATGVAMATQSRLEAGSGKILLGTLIALLKGVGELERFALFFSDHDAEDDGKKSRVRHTLSTIDQSDAQPLGAAQYIALQEKQPNIEAKVTPRAAVHLSKVGFAVRHAVEDGENVIYATTMARAVDSKHKYQAPDGSMVGGIKKMGLTLAAKAMTDEQYSRFRLFEDKFIAAVNERFQKDHIRGAIEHVELSEEAEFHNLVFLDTGRDVDAVFIMDTIINTLNKLDKLK